MVSWRGSCGSTQIGMWEPGHVFVNCKYLGFKGPLSQKRKGRTRAIAPSWLAEDLELGSECYPKIAVRRITRLDSCYGRVGLIVRNE